MEKLEGPRLGGAALPPVGWGWARPGAGFMLAQEARPRFSGLWPHHRPCYPMGLLSQWGPPLGWDSVCCLRLVNRYFLSTYYGPGAVLGAGGIHIPVGEVEK